MVSLELHTERHVMLIQLTQKVAVFIRQHSGGYAICIWQGCTKYSFLARMLADLLFDGVSLSRVCIV